jgi:hypothetical protein
MRSRDMHMSAKAIVDKRAVLLSGSIDENGLTVGARFTLPEPGIWTVYKAETNLTDDAWQAWQVRVGGGATLVTNEEAMTACQQYDNITFLKEPEGVIFHGGQVRPGEPILKIFTINASGGSDVVSHNRSILLPDDLLEDAVSRGFGFEEPVLTIDVPVKVI